MTDWRRLWREETGSQVLEFILTFPLVWVLLVFAFDQFTIMYNKQRVLSAAFEAGRIASVQPNFGLASYHGEEHGMAELEQGMAVERGEIEILPQGRWKKGNHFEVKATLSFRLPATGERYELSESYFMMVENAGDDDR
ncbi:pilus assembly protein [Brevibacillus sp. SYP-B805]|uniref:TadE/TadG family type IV pilus assembly protein n=1 Tax=Brevibacillus sp. SYP-B805 TaxID=1578199 RepID=UPI0013EC8872|nr:TadE family protein [Brevibacillus sp. SYP-B805]NGQ96436.1 pilus assembly protein [Brevibacillus sp. SYP-B805]